MASIDRAIGLAMRDRRLNKVMAQYFPGAALTCDPRVSLVVNVEQAHELDGARRASHDPSHCTIIARTSTRATSTRRSYSAMIVACTSSTLRRAPVRLLHVHHERSTGIARERGAGRGHAITLLRRRSRMARPIALVDGRHVALSPRARRPQRDVLEPHLRLSPAAVVDEIVEGETGAIPDLTSRRIGQAPPGSALFAWSLLRERALAHLDSASVEPSEWSILDFVMVASRRGRGLSPAHPSPMRIKSDTEL